MGAFFMQSYVSTCLSIVLTDYASVIDCLSLLECLFHILSALAILDFTGCAGFYCLYLLCRQVKHLFIERTCIYMSLVLLKSSLSLFIHFLLLLLD